MHRSRLCHFVIDVPDLEHGRRVLVGGAQRHRKKIVSEQSRHIYRRLRLPDSEIRILLQGRPATGRPARKRMHLDLETDNVGSRSPPAGGPSAPPAGITRPNAAFDFWVLRDPWGNEFCVPAAGVPRTPGPARSPGITDPSLANQRFPGWRQEHKPRTAGTVSPSGSRFWPSHRFWHPV